MVIAVFQVLYTSANLSSYKYTDDGIHNQNKAHGHDGMSQRVL